MWNQTLMLLRYGDSLVSVPIARNCFLTLHTYLLRTAYRTCPAEDPLALIFAMEDCNVPSSLQGPMCFGYLEDCVQFHTQTSNNHTSTDCSVFEVLMTTRLYIIETRSWKRFPGIKAILQGFG